MEYQLTPDDLKVGKEYYIEFYGDIENITKFNGTYIYGYDNCGYACYNYEFKNTKNGYYLKLQYTMVTDNLNLTNNLQFNGYCYCELDEYIEYGFCDISEPTSEYVLK